MSVRASSGSPRICSGDMYPEVPFTMPTIVRLARESDLAMPKSSSLVVPSYVTMMFFSATSR